ncbi:putative esterase [Streptococcus oralis]|uniref:Putative esterase n=1 Tax=Streptococcus oralis TaxID=1303 RepID=A0A3R9M658_STROR|nr:alpha/beta hydrolase-fold protein [Streptococcus oralis]RSK10226.1 putative esterase [Streptococcus oralis]
MTLSINNEFDWEGIQVKVSLPSIYDPNQTYPAILLNDGDLDFLSSLSESVILVGLSSKNRLDDYTPWKASALRDGTPDFGGQANAYHGHLFGGLLDKLQSLYRLDKDHLAYGGYSLGGLAAVYSLFGFDKVSCVFSICGSFWYPDFVAYCKEQKLKNLDCLLYILNGQTEGAQHTNRLAQAPVYAERIHTSLQKRYPTGQFVFDTYGHHEQVAERFVAFSNWLTKKWKIE